jgi:hypothetical protein
MKTPPSTGGGAFILNEQWIAVDPFMLKTKLDDGISDAEGARVGRVRVRRRLTLFIDR